MTEDEARETTEAAEKPARSRSKKQDSAPASGYAIVETGGKQYRVKVGDRIRVERLHADAGSDISLDRVLLLGGTGATTVGAPVVDGASVSAHIEDHLRGEKIYVFKYKAKKRYRRKIGHRQELTELTITGINA
jgi:large subunit ribosomal protein L21